jgi:uncharacterized membrane protein YhaH (DUF805 family)
MSGRRTGSLSDRSTGVPSSDIHPGDRGTLRPEEAEMTREFGEAAVTPSPYGDRMIKSRQFAGLIGPTLIALTVSEVTGPRIWANVAATQVYLAGTLWFVSGVAIVRGHNRWAAGWPLVVTVLGWFAILGGLFRMFAPEFARQNVPQPGALLVMQVVLLVIGAFLTFKAYASAGGSKRSGA